MKIQGIDHVEYYVGDLEASVASLCRSFGFRVAGSSASGQAGGSRLLRQGQVQLLVTAPCDETDVAAQFVRTHGDGIGVIAFAVDDVAAAFTEAVTAGARPVRAPEFAGQPGSRVGTAVVSGFGDVTHQLVQREGGAEFAPGSITMSPAQADDGLLAVLDHVAVCLPAGQLEPTVEFYRDVFGLAQIFDERIEVGGQAMLSKVVQDPGRNATFTLIEPDLTLEPGQIDDFLKSHDGAGVQHLAFLTNDIGGAIRTMSARGVDFLTAPDGYYRALESRLGELAIPAGELRELNVLADSDPWGQMFQIFTISTHERKTFFLELIERRGGRTFGTRNIHALYEALEETRAGHN
jgi:4-hydroxymandelate synthase